MANPTITINATGITVSGPLIAGEPLAVTASGLSLPEDAALTLALSSRAPNALLASCVLAESEETPGTWTGTLETASRQMAVYFATAAADDTRPAVLELVETTTRDSLALLVTSIRNSALIPSSSPCAVAPVYLPIPGPPGPPGQGGDPYDQAPLMDGGASAGTSDDYARGDHRHPTDTSRASTIALFEGLAAKQDTISDLSAIRSGAAAGATAVQPAALSDYRTASAQDAIDGAQDTAIAAKYTKPATGIPASDLAAGVIPSAPSASDATPLMDGTGAAGTATTYARGDHQHQSDTAKVNKSGDTMTGLLTVPGMVANAPGLLVSGTNGESAQVGAGDGEAYAVFSDGSGHSVSIGAGGPTEFNVADGDDDFDVALPKNNGTLALQEGIAPAFSSSSTYAVGDYVTHEGLLYKCTTAVSTAGAWNAANWTAVAVTDEMGGGGGGLPYDAEVGYILATDGQYIDTGIAANTITGASGIVSTSSGTKSMFGARDGAGSNMLYFGYYTTNVNGFRLSYGSSTDGNKVSSSHLSGFVSLGWNQSTMWYGDNSTRVSLSGSVTSRNAYLFTFNNGGTPLTGETTTMAIRSFQIFGANGEVLRDYIAVRKNGVGYLYDRVSGALFGNDGTGVFSFASDLNNLRYSFASPTPSVSGTAATVACEDRAINDFTIATGVTSLTITPPAAVTGRARDFFCRVTLTDSSLPTVTLSGATIDIGATEVAGMTQGVNLLMFTEIASGHWIASRRSAS